MAKNTIPTEDTATINTNTNNEDTTNMLPNTPTQIAQDNETVNDSKPEQANPPTLDTLPTELLYAIRRIVRRHKHIFTPANEIALNEIAAEMTAEHNIGGLIAYGYNFLHTPPTSSKGKAERTKRPILSPEDKQARKAEQAKAQQKRLRDALGLNAEVDTYNALVGQSFQLQVKPNHIVTLSEVIERGNRALITLPNGETTTVRLSSLGEPISS